MCRALQPARDPFVAGAVLPHATGRLVLDARIGEGGMGVVWRAWRFHAPGTPGADRPEVVALKVLRPSAMRQTAVRDLFLREAEAMRRLSHPNVVAFHDLFEADGALVLALEYVDGETLEAVVARHRARGRLAGAGGLPCMPFLRAWFYFQQLLGALAAIHALGIVHRDVKPSNVLIRRDGVVKLADFGIVRFAGRPSSAATAALELGTGAYMSPEQVLSRPIDARSDLYGAATVLYEMLSGRTPFDAERGEFLVRKDQVDATPPPIRTAVPEAPFVLDALFARALAKDPAARFESAVEMGDAFRIGLGLPETPEWQAQSDLARVAQTLLVPAARGAPDGAHQKLATLREFVAHGYKTKRLSAV